MQDMVDWHTGHLRILVAAHILQSQIISFQGINHSIIDGEVGDLGVLVLREGEVHALPGLVNLVQRLQV